MHYESCVIIICSFSVINYIDQLKYRLQQGLRKSCCVSNVHMGGKRNSNFLVVFRTLSKTAKLNSLEGEEGVKPYS